MSLQPVRANRVFVVVDAHEEEIFVSAAVNAVNAARAAYGLTCPEVAVLSPPVVLESAYSSFGTAGGSVEDLAPLLQLLRGKRGQFDAVALSSVISVPPEFHHQYFAEEGRMINPWGGVEALLTHTVSSALDVPSAHSPMFESTQIANADPGVVEPRMAAEAVSLTFLQCILKGLHRSPRVVTDEAALKAQDLVRVEDVSCLVIPDGCVGLPTLAALEQGIPVIAVGENRNIMRNDLSMFPWREGQLHRVENYWEAAGVIAALRVGIEPSAVRRPLRRVAVRTRHHIAASDGAEAPQVGVDAAPSRILWKREMA